ncbi:MAG: hypothetical protein ACP5LR_06460, partial [Athalassotoga sp.]|uniref:hypothetical protein n=1 Tax=Athalassotoga sp. TaxID=2022597 RepID=UPI003D06B55F
IEQKTLQSPQNTENVPQEALEEIYSLVPPDQITESLRQIIKTYYTVNGSEYIKNAVEYVNKQKPKNYLAYLKSTLESHYAEVLEKEKENEEKRIAEERKKERIKNLEDEIDKLTYQRDLEIEKTAKSIFESLPESVKEQIIKLSKATILEENPNENVNSTDHIFTVKLNIYTLDTVKSLYPDKFKEIHDKFDKQIDNLREEIKSI